MFQCHVALALPLAYASDPENTPIYFIIGDYNFMPDLQIEEEVEIFWKLGSRGEKPLKCKASVVRSFKQIIPNGGKDKDIFRLTIVLEVLDKEDLPRVCKILKDLNPRTIVDPLPSSFTESSED